VNATRSYHIETVLRDGEHVYTIVSPSGSPLYTFATLASAEAELEALKGSETWRLAAIRERRAA
jgi:hypothetical protein